MRTHRWRKREGETVRVYTDEGDGQRQLIGRADVPDDCGPVYEVPLFGDRSVIRERFAVAMVVRPSRGEEAHFERAVLAAPGQMVELLPGWAPLAS